MNGTLGRGIEVGLRQPQVDQNQMAYRQQQAQAQDPNYGQYLDDILKGDYEQVEGKTMQIFNDWGEARNYAQAMWKNFGIDVMTPDFSNPASVMASNAFMKKMAALRNEANAAKRGLEDRNVMQKWANDPNMQIAKQTEGEWSNTDGSYSVGYTDEQKFLANEVYTPEVGDENYNKVRGEKARILQNHDDLIAEAEAAGDHQRAEQERKRKARTQVMMAKKALPEGIGNTERVTEVVTRWNTIAEIMQGQDKAWADPADNPLGFLGYDNSNVNIWTGKLYASKDGEGKSFPISGETAAVGINNMLNDAMTEKVKLSTLYGFGKKTLKALNIDIDKALPDVDKDYTDGVDKWVKDLKEGDLDDALGGVGFNERRWFVPSDFKIVKGDEVADAGGNTLIKTVEGINSDGWLEFETEDQINPAATGKLKINLNTAKGIQQAKELLGYNFNFRLATLDKYGYLDEDRPDFDSNISVNPYKSTYSDKQLEHWRQVGQTATGPNK